MPKAYVSSTYGDLKAHREVASRVLRSFGYDDVAIEYFVAGAERPVEKGLLDLAACDLYVGLFAWRYGFIPKERNPENFSITELEYWLAVRLKKPRLLFIVTPDATWQPSWMDGNRTRMTAFRETLLHEPCWYFSTPESLEAQLSSALAPLQSRHTSVRRIEELAASPELIARFLSKAALRDRGRLALLESPTTAGVSDFLRDQKVDKPAAFAELMDVLETGSDFEPDPLWLAWITNIHAERLSEIGRELLLQYSGKTPE